MTLYVGTSGWQYPHWRDRFYPRGVPQRRWLEFYAERFGAVEVDYAFYRLPERHVFERWRERTPPGFAMAVKASRFLTHVRRLRDPGEPVARLMDRAAGLGPRLGPVLLQLPPTMAAEPGRLEECLRAFPEGVRVAVEFRHDSWWTPRVRTVLESAGAALCWADRAGRPVSPLWRTAGFGYVRFHEGRASPPPRYGRRALARWAERVADAWPGGEDVYAFFNNDPGGAAVADAQAFGRLAAAAAAGTAAGAATVRRP